MLRNYLSLSLLFLPLLLSAQGDRDLLLGGTVNFSTSQTTREFERTITVNDPNNPLGPTTFTQTVEEDFSATSFGFFPYLGRVVSPWLSVGLGVSLSASRQKGGINAEESVSDQIGGFLWFRYTLNPTNKLRAYIEPRLGYDRFTGNRFFFTGSGPLFDGNVSEAGLRVPLGAVYSLSDRLVANVRIGTFELVRGSWEENDGPGTARYTDIGFRLNPRTISFGVEFIL